LLPAAAIRGLEQQQAQLEQRAAEVQQRKSLSLVLAPPQASSSSGIFCRLPALAPQPPLLAVTLHTCRPHPAAAGLASEHSQVAELQAELAKVQAEQDALPGLVREVQEALEAEAAAFQRQEAGG
jgi:hypothetical protein